MVQPDAGPCGKLGSFVPITGFVGATLVVARTRQAEWVHSCTWAAQGRPYELDLFSEKRAARACNRGWAKPENAAARRPSRSPEAAAAFPILPKFHRELPELRRIATEIGWKPTDGEWGPDPRKDAAGVDGRVACANISWCGPRSHSFCRCLRSVMGQSAWRGPSMNAGRGRVGPRQAAAIGITALIVRPSASAGTSGRLATRRRARALH